VAVEVGEELHLDLVYHSTKRTVSYPRVK